MVTSSVCVEGIVGSYSCRAGDSQNSRGQGSLEEYSSTVGENRAKINWGLSPNFSFCWNGFHHPIVREFTRLGLSRSVGGVLALAFARELSPVVTSIVVAGRIGSAFAAELGTMQVSEQTDTLRVLGTNPVDYLVTPRVIASCVALPFLTLMCFTIGMASSAVLSDAVYGVSINIILDSARRTLNSWDIISAMIKSQMFGAIISVVSCAWGVTTLEELKVWVSRRLTSVVISLVGIFIADFVLSYSFFPGCGGFIKELHVKQFLFE